MSTITNLGVRRFIPGFKKRVNEEFNKGYMTYALSANAGITDMLNSDFNKLYPNYFKENQDKEWYELTEYNKFMADGYQKYIVSGINKLHESMLLEFYVDPTDCVLKARLK